MTNQEQSEKIVYGSLITSTKCYNCIHFLLCFAKGGVNLELASENNCFYYQSNLSADSVVISKEEYDTLKAENDKYVKDCIDYIATISKLENKVWEVERQARKETAEEILNAVVGAIDNGTFFRKSFIFMMNKVYGVEVEMANNDKTIEQANKKIVRQFYNKIQKMLDETRQVIEEPCNGRQNAGYCVADVDNGLKELAKQFKVEIKE